MIEKLSIKNFKSIKDLNIDCKRINLFIGEPNAGKSNILEAIGLLSWLKYGHSNPKEFIRFQSTQNLFYDDLLEEVVEINIHKFNFKIIFKRDYFYFYMNTTENSNMENKDKPIGSFDYSGEERHSRSNISDFEFIKYYKFLKQNTFDDRNSSFLLPPHGPNLFAIVMASKKMRETVSSFFKNFGFKLVLKPQERTFEIQKQVNDLVFSYPYILTSDTLQTIIFHAIAIESNSNSTLVFEEPEAHTFPYYTKYLGEKIALDESNQYFIATHNLNFLQAILEKTKKDDLSVFITYFQDYQTKVKCLTEKQLSELMDYDPFFNLKAFIEEE